MMRSLPVRPLLMMSLILLAATVSQAQTPSQAPAGTDTTRRDGATAEPAPPRPPGPTQDGFRPSEEVSADQEVDFPADL